MTEFTKQELYNIIVHLCDDNVDEVIKVMSFQYAHIPPPEEERLRLREEGVCWIDPKPLSKAVVLERLSKNEVSKFDFIDYMEYRWEDIRFDEGKNQKTIPAMEKFIAICKAKYQKS